MVRPTEQLGSQFTNVASTVTKSTCNHCLGVLNNRQKAYRLRHLISCQAFLDTLLHQLANSDPELEQWPQDQLQTFLKVVNKTYIPVRKSSTITTTYIDPKEELNTLAAMAVYKGGMPFNVYASNPDLLQLLSKLHYTPPSRARLSGELLKQCYLTVKAQVDQVIAEEAPRGYPRPYLNFITDESGEASLPPPPPPFLSLPLSFSQLTID